MRALLLSTILVFALVIRLWNITTLPPSLYSDEVDISYQAQIFNQKHTDYFGNFFPINFHSFSDWQPGAGIYVTALFQTITHNNDLSVRIPSAIFGVISIFVLYLLTNSLYPSFLLSISPWAIHYSRTGFAVSGMLMCLLLAIYFFKNKKYYLFSIFLCLSPYFYSTAKLFVPFILLASYLKHKNKSIILFSLLLLLPMGVDTIKGQAGFRFSYISIFTMPHREQITDTLRYQDILLSHPNQTGVKTPIYSQILHNKIQISVSKFIENYFSSFSTKFLFLTGDDNIRHGFGNHGLLYIIDFFSIFIGLFIYKNKPTKLGNLFFWILLLAPIPFALTRDSIGPHSTRLILMLPSLIYFSSLALKKYKILIPIYLLLFISFWHYYTIHYPQDSASAWHYNMANSIIESKKYNYTQIYFSDKYEPFLPFFLNYQPYLKPINLIDTNNNYFTGKNLDNRYYFGNINWSEINSFPQKSIFVVPELENVQVPSSLKLLKIIPKKYEMAQNFYIYEK